MENTLFPIDFVNSTTLEKVVSVDMVLACACGDYGVGVVRWRWLVVRSACVLMRHVKIPPSPAPAMTKTKNASDPKKNGRCTMRA